MFKWLINKFRTLRDKPQEIKQEPQEDIELCYCPPYLPHLYHYTYSPIFHWYGLVSNVHMTKLICEQELILERSEKIIELLRMQNNEVEKQKVEERVSWFLDMLRQESEGRVINNMGSPEDFMYCCYSCSLLIELRKYAKDILEGNIHQEILGTNKSETLEEFARDVLTEGFHVKHEFYIKYKIIFRWILYPLVREILEGQGDLDEMIESYKK